MRCIERLAVWLAALGLAACSGRSSPPVPPDIASPSGALTPSVKVGAAAATSAPSGSRRADLPLPAPARMRRWADVRQQAAERLVAANPDMTYMGTVPDRLLAIPVLEVELNGDGSVRRVQVLREPREAKETLKLAVEAIRRAAPYGEVSHLPKPWKFVETFLFDDDHKFKPRTLDH